jgi:hypothetical protein
MNELFLAMDIVLRVRKEKKMAIEKSMSKKSLIQMSATIALVKVCGQVVTVLIEHILFPCRNDEE